MVGKICTVCRRCSYIDKQLSYFTYPADALRRQEWLSAVNRLDLMAKLNNHKTRGNHRICEVHFEDKYIRRSKINEGRKCLTKDAFPTLCLTPPCEDVPMSNDKFLKPSPIMYPQNLVWQNSSNRKQTLAKVNPTSAISHYNLPVKQEKNMVKHDEKPVKGNVHYLTKEVYIKLESPPSPPHYGDALQFCESIMKASKWTQTPVRPVINVKRTLQEPPELKRLKVEEAQNDKKTFLQMCSKFLSPSLLKLVKWKLNTTNGKQNVNITLFALNLYYSSNLFNLLRDMLSLPSRETLKYFLLPKTTRISGHFLNAFRCKINNMSTKERICSFSVGTILLKPNLYYDIKYDRIIGIEDINGIQNIRLAKYAVLLMVQGILEDWRQPIAYAFISEYDNSPSISLWINEVLTILIDIGLDIRAFVSDPRSEFLYASESRYVSPEKTYFTMNGTDIFYYYDTSQLLKIVKNNLKSCNFYYGSNSMSSNNADFLEKLNNLCNLLNAKVRGSNDQYKTAFSNKKYQIDFLSHMMKLFQDLKVVRKADGLDVTENMKFIEGFQITINSVLQLFEELKFLGVKYLLTGHLNHNCLNRFFANMRLSFDKDECTPRQLNRSFVRSFVFNMLKKPVGSNTIETSLDSEDFSQQLLDDEVLEAENICKPLLVHTSDYRDNLPERNAFVYVCGYCYLKCIQVHNCEAFQFYLQGFPRKQEKDDTSYICSISLDMNVQNSNMLPPDDFTDFIMLLENKFKQCFEGNVQIRSVGHEILKEFEQCGFGMPCPCFPIEYLKALFIRVRLFYTIRKNNKLLKKKKGVKSLRIFSL